MRIFNFGSLNIDHVYTVDRFVSPGETIASLGYQRFCGGKGCNQSVALALAGAAVVHVGSIGPDGAWVRQRLADSGADVSLVRTGKVPTGHAVIQVSAQGENAIIVHGGANRALSDDDIEALLVAARPGDWVLAQNETNHVGRLLARAKDAGLMTAFNPAPFDERVREAPLDRVDLFFVNETEGRGLSGASSADAVLGRLIDRFPTARIVLTLGEAGAWYRDAETDLRIPAVPADTVDTTAAGDTFIGYFMAELSRASSIERCLRFACAAAAVCVGRPGATDAIPRRADVERLVSSSGRRI